MKLLLKIVGSLLALVLIGVGVAWVWFWGRPVGITNYVNRETVRMATTSPEAMTFAGLDGTPVDRHSHRLGDTTRAESDRLLAMGRDARDGLERFGPEGRAWSRMDAEERRTYRIVSSLADNVLSGMERRWSGYPISQLFGPQVNTPEFLLQRHKIGDARSARNYVSRVRDFGRVMEETLVNVDEAAADGVVAPDFILRAIVSDMRGFIEGGAEANPLVADFRTRLAEVEALDEAERAALVADAREAVATRVIPGYEALIARLEELAETAGSEAGITRIPDGAAIYADAVRTNTTTDYTPDELHELGLSEVERLEAAMDAILRGEGLTEGTVGARVQTLMADPAHHFPNTDEGREELLAYLEDLNTEIMELSAPVFATIPEAELEIKRVAEFAQDSAPGGSYSPPPPFGDGPGTFYINLKDTADNPKWTLPTLLVHEAVPGHHFQITRGMALEGVPMIRKFSPYTAYTEGWALYAERMMADDLGLYEGRPLDRLGQLQAEMFRAVRLVVDTGLHARGWSRERAIDYMVEKTGMTEAEVTREIERYIVWPGQALAYKTGQMALLDMRDRARERLGERFSLRDFHEVVLESGALPLDMLSAKVDAWTERVLAEDA